MSVDGLAGLRVGDTVAVHGGGSSTRIWFSTVDRITPTGRIRVGDTTYRPNGWEIGGDSWAQLHITRVTPEITEKVRRQRLLVACGAIRFDSLTTDALVRIAATAKEGRIDDAAAAAP